MILRNHNVEIRLDKNLPGSHVDAIVIGCNNCKHKLS